ASEGPRLEPDGRKALDHVRFLASDEMGGRKSGTPGYERAAAYVADRMKEYGLRPGGEGGTYFQPVPFKTWSHFEQPLRLEIVSPRSLRYFPGRGRDFQPVPGTGSGALRARPVFAGFGVVADKAGWDDYGTLDVKGRVVLVIEGGPDALEEPARKDWTLLKKAKLAAEKGASALIELDVTETAPSPAGRRPSFSPWPAGSCPEGFLVFRAGRHFPDDLFYTARKSWRDAVSRTLRLKRPQPIVLDGVEVEMEAHYVSGERTAPNVLGILPGTDRRLRDEVLIVGGHLDHLGVGLDGFVYPGADDNACSAAVILETARVLAAENFRPRRTILFAAWAGEELGLVGSRRYTEHPRFPLKNTAAYLNIDMVGVGDDDLFVGGMWEYGRFFDILQRGLSGDIRARLHSRRSYRGSDHSAFWNKGVTAVSLRTGELLTRGLDDEHPEYHRPGDGPELIDPDLLELAARYHLQALRHLANTKENLMNEDFRAEFLHKDADVIDLHCDTIGRFVRGEDLRQDLTRGHVDIPKLKRGAVDLQVFACFTGAPASEEERDRDIRAAFREIDAVRRLAEENPADLAVVRSPEDFQALRGTGRTAMLIGVEGGYTITDDLSLLRAYYDSGVRLMTLTHWTHTGWADASGDARPVFNGLSGFGRTLVAEMNRLGMVIDLSHASDKTFWDVLEVSSAPVVASHSCCRALAEHHRNLTDDMLKALARKGGMVGINFSAGFLDSSREVHQAALRAEVARKFGLPEDDSRFMRADPEKREAAAREFRERWREKRKTLPPVDVGTLADHIDHVVQVTGGADHVGLGSDYDGISETPDGLEDVGKLENITRELRARGYGEADIRKILGGNFLRVWNAVVSKRGAAAAGR
ncbi:MAG: M20/M25/M40 family metallo-hydrolase, partial [Candidatus Aminicenantes bacterium]|nr:M20/M25/M40 family metallo-hydrolase [Candidatus Aminicenantes bacterium]